jgi:hypothetical protein
VQWYTAASDIPGLHLHRPLLLARQSSPLLFCRQVSKRGGLQRDVVYIGWPIAPSYMSPTAGEGEGRSCVVSANVYSHRINMEVDLQSLFGLHVMWCAQLYSLAEWDPATPTPPLHLDSNTKALLVSEDSPTKDCAVSAPEQDMMLRSEELQHAHQRCGQPSLRSQLALQQQARLAIYAPMIYTSVADPWHFGVDPALDSRIHASD